MRLCTITKAQIARVAACTLLLASLYGCAVQFFPGGDAKEAAAGRYAQAVDTLQRGVAAHPDSVELQAALVRTRTQAISTSLAAAERLRAAGKLDDAQTELARAREVDPSNSRARDLDTDIAIQRRQDSAEHEAEYLLAKGERSAALRVVREALKDDPRHAGLRALARRIELANRDDALKSSRTVLAEVRPISLDFRDASLRSVLDMVSRASGINFVLDRDIRPDARITVNLRQVSVEDALDLISETNQLAVKVLDPHTVMIYPDTADKQREYQEQVVRVFYLDSADAKGAATFLKSMLKIREPFVDERSNMLALRDTPTNIALAERLISLYDSAEPEVLLEMNVLEINATRLTELGVQLPSNITLTPIAPGTGSDGSSSSGLTLGNIRSLTRDDIALGLGGVTINLRREVGDFTTLANPQIRVRSKHKASVLVGDKIPVVTATTGTGGFVSDSVNYLDVGLKLEVEPTVYANDDVSIKVALEVSSLGSPVKTASGTLAYQIGTRDATTTLRLRDGETQLLAGLISKDESSDSNRVPLLGDIPLLGRLFSSQLDNGQRKELVLSITPHVLRNARRLDASETELWVGTDASPRLRPYGGVAAVDGHKDVPASAAGSPRAAHAGGPGAPPPAKPTSASSPDPAASAPSAAPTMTMKGPHEAKVGEVVTLDVTLDSPSELRGMPLTVHFDPKALSLTGVTEGDFFRRDGVATSFTRAGDAATGEVSVGILRNQASGAHGDGTVVRLAFKALKAGPTQVAVVKARGLGLDAPAPAIPDVPTFALVVH